MSGTTDSSANADLRAAATAAGDAAVKARFGLWDAVSIIVGIVVGTAIFKVPMMVCQNVGGPWQALGVWLLGGVLSLFGAFCYAELATTYPRSGGDYEYLTRAFGPWLGFLFGWAQLTVVLTGSIGAMAYAFADYGARLWNLDGVAIPWLAAAAIIVLSVANLLGTVVGKFAQNVLSATKVIGLCGIVAAGLLFADGEPQQAAAPQAASSLGLALVFVLLAYGGWNDAAFVAAEVRDRRRNLPIALIMGVAGVTAIYLTVNAVYIYALGFEGVRQSFTPAADVLNVSLGKFAAQVISVLVMISALGAINGMILTGSRIYAELGMDHKAMAWLGHWDRRRGSPVMALLAQGAVALLLVCSVGTETGQNVIDALVASVGLKAIPWQQYFGGFETLVAASAPVFWMFFLLTGLSLFILRLKDKRRDRPFSVPWYPLPPLVFCGTCSYMLYSSLMYAWSLALFGVAALLLGLPLYFIGRGTSRRPV